MQIIQKNPTEVECDWQKELAKAFKSPQTLLEYLDIPAHLHSHHFAARRLFPMMVPRFFADLMQVGNADDPLLKQVLPDAQEFIDTPGFTHDPLLEQTDTPAGLLRKYKNRALLIVRGGCAVNCRYCFRRHFPYQDHQLTGEHLQSSLDFIAADTDLNEVILSGGDPLMAKDHFLYELIQRLQNIQHIKRVRIHTRLPVVLPKRITKGLLDCLQQTRLTAIMVLHINHPQEVSDALLKQVKSLRQSDVRVLNQAVLLRGINDTADIQIALNERLFDGGIQPYYLHLLDKVAGAAHFDVSEQHAIDIIRQVIARQSGYMVPKLVREIAGKPSKIPIDLYA